MALRSTLVLALALSLGPSVLGCGPPWNVIRASGPPSSLAGMTTMGVTFDYSALFMGGMPEQQWLMGQPPEDQQAYLEVRAIMEEQLLAELAAQLGREGIGIGRANGTESHQLVLRYTRIEMGFYRFIVNMDSTLDSTVLFGPTGTMTDEITIHTTREANRRNASILERMSYCARRIAQLAAQYVRQARTQ